MIDLTKREKYIIGFLILVLVLFIGEKYYRNQLKLSIIEVKEEDTEEKEDIPSKENKMDQKNVLEEQWILVDICGEVVNPGVVKLKEGDRVVDAVNLAGGLLKNADRNQVNMARVIGDGEQIYIPKIGENIEMQHNEKSSGIIKKPDRININTASINELNTLGGIGEVLAERVVTYRQTNGKFKDTDEIMKVPGIGQKKFESIKDRISTD